MVSQALQSGNDTSTLEAGEHSGPGVVPVVEGDSDNDDSNNDPMVSAPIRPFLIPITLRNTRSGVEVRQGALIDSG